MANMPPTAVEDICCGTDHDAYQ